jgi:small GTP-binding protein
MSFSSSGSGDSLGSASTSSLASTSSSSGILFANQFKILMIGDSGVGKSSILHRYANDQFSPNFLPTIGIDYRIKLLTIEDKMGKRNFRLSLWDTAGQERFRNITKQYFRGAHGMVLVYDSTDRVSFDNVQHWISQIENADLGSPSGVIVTLVANKCDQPNQEVGEDEGQALADEKGIRFFKTSAKQNINVSELFLTLVLDVERRQISRRALDKLDEMSEYSETVHLTKSERNGAGSEYRGSAGCCGGSVTVPDRQQ